MKRRAKRRRLHIGKTEVLGIVGVGGTLAAVALEYAHVWRQGSAPLPLEVDGGVEVFAAGAEAARETVEVAFEGYRGGSKQENALLNLLVAFSITLGATRTAVHVIHARGGPVGPFRNVKLGRRHIHHFVPGIVLAFAAGGTAILSRDAGLEPWLAVPFGAGLALTLDESALLLELEDVYWSEEGILSVQVALAAMAMLATTAVALRVLRRGEREVLGAPARPLPSAP